MTASRLEMALDRLDDAMLEVTEARKAQAALAEPPGIVAGIKHVFSKVNVAAVKSAPAVPPVLPAKTVAAPVKRPAASTVSPVSVQKPVSVPQMVTRSHPHKRKTAGM